MMVVKVGLSLITTYGRITPSQQASSTFFTGFSDFA